MVRVERGGVNETIVGKIQLGSHRSFSLSSRMERAKVVQREISKRYEVEIFSFKRKKITGFDCVDAQNEFVCRENSEVDE